MDVPARTDQGAVARSAPPDLCPYCGARLDPLFYFCTHCATPYKAVEAVLPHARPVRLTEGELIEMKAPHVAPMFWTYVAVVVGTAVFSMQVFTYRRPDLALIFQTTAIFITTCVFASLHWTSLAVQFRRFGFLNASAWVALLAILPALLLVNYLYHGFLVHELDIKDALLTTRLRKAGVGEAALVFIFCALPAVTEEVAFRGLVQHWLQTALRPARALVLASALFMALHFSVLSAPYLFAVGMLLGWAKWKTGSLYPSMLIHFLHNLAVLEFFAF